MNFNIWTSCMGLICANFSWDFVHLASFISLPFTFLTMMNVAYEEL